MKQISFKFLPFPSLVRNFRLLKPNRFDTHAHVGVLLSDTHLLSGRASVVYLAALF